ncbi:MAG: hypothetical protein ACLQMF_10130 [Rectinemataceae bacterium]
MKFGIDTTLSPAIRLVDSVKDAYALLGAKVTTDPSLNLAANLTVKAIKSQLPANNPDLGIGGIPANETTKIVERVLSVASIVRAVLKYF